MKRVMVQEDQAEGLGLLYYSLYTVDEGFQAPPEHTVNPNTWVLVMTHPGTMILGMSHVSYMRYIDTD